MSVKGKRIVVTGGARGIGARLVGELRERGAEVTSTDILPGCDIFCDVSNEQDVIALFDQVGDIDGLVNNAALLVGRRSFHEISIEEWDRMMALNARSFAGLLHAFLPGMLARGEGRVVHEAGRAADRDVLVSRWQCRITTCRPPTGPWALPTPSAQYRSGRWRRIAGISASPSSE